MPLIALRRITPYVNSYLSDPNWIPCREIYNTPEIACIWKSWTLLRRKRSTKSVKDRLLKVISTFLKEDHIHRIRYLIRKNVLGVRLHYQFSGIPGLPNFPEKMAHVIHTKYQYRARGKSYNLRSNVVRILRFLIRLVDIQIFIPNLRSNIVRILTLNHMQGKLFSICHSTDVALHSKRLRLLVLGPSAEKFCRHSSPCGEEYQHCTDLSQW